jgi:hypothetical protein
MAALKSTSIQAKLTITLELDEMEVRALDGIFGYDVNEFLKVFYEKMGTSYLKPYEAGVRSLQKTMRGLVAGPLAEVDDARKAIHEALK